jgi:predicted Rossmann fold flavoprotein
MSDQKQLVVIGGGAAGFFCAVNAARLNPQLQVTIIEKSNKLLSKVRISGGGRCNTTHACFDIPEMAAKYPRGDKFLRKTLHWFNPQHTIDWFAERGVVLKTEADGRMFPNTDNSQTIIDCLLREATKYGVQIIMQSEVKSLEPGVNDQWVVHTSNARLLTPDYVCIACGGYPKSSMFEWLTKLGHTIENPVPSLFTFNMPGNIITGLMGVSVEKATVKVTGTKLVQQGPLLITHWGMSGPVILRLSAWGARQLAGMNYQFKILVNWLGEQNEQQLRENWISLRDQFATQKIGGKNPFALPSRLWQYFLSISYIDPETRWAELGSKAQQLLIKNLTTQEFSINGKTTFKEEFVTCGGIKLAEIEPNTMQSRLKPGIFFAGEIMDVDGITGGFNFQHAWTSGWLAGSSIARASI